MNSLLIYDTFGLGHSTRCKALSQAFYERGICSMGIEYEERLEDKIRDVSSGFNFVVVDSYIASKEFYEQIDDITNLVVIDDYNRLEYPENSLVLNHSREKEYTLLRKEFWNRPKKKINRNIENIMICLGETEKAKDIEDKIRNKFWNSQYTLVIPTNFIAKEMIGLMLWADIAISGCGMILNELACIGVPTIGITLFDNTMDNGIYFMKNGFIYGTLGCKGINYIEGFIKNPRFDYKNRKRMNKIGRKIVRGDGALKFVDKIIKNFT